MIRTQIQLTEEQSNHLKSIAHDRGCSVAEVIREALDTYLTDIPDRKAKRAQMLASIGGFHSGLTDVSVNHDRYLG